MEKIQELNDPNTFVRNVYFGFENLLPTKSKNKENKVINSKPNKLTNKSKKKKKIKSKNKEKFKSENNNNEDNMVIKPYKNEEPQEEKNTENKKKKNSKQKKKKENIKEEKQIEDLDNNENEEKNVKKKKPKSKSKNKKKSKDKNKDVKKKKKKKSKSKKKLNKNESIQTMIHEVNNDILDYIDKESPQYNEIQDNAMNEVEKHIHDLSLTFMKPIIPKKENTFSKTFLKSKKDKKAKNSDNQKNDLFNINSIINNNNQLSNKRPYTAHAYKVKSKSKKLTKTIKNKQEEEKIMAFKEKVYVHDKILSLFNNFQKIDNNEEKTKFNKTAKPRINSAFTKKVSNHYMIPKQKDILKLKKIKKKEIEYYDDKYEEDSEEIKRDENEENIIKNKNDKAIYLIKSSHKKYGKSQKSLSEIKHILNKNNIETFMNNFLIKHNFDTKKEEYKLNYYYDIPKIKYYHGGKKIYRPNLSEMNIDKKNNSDDNILKYKNDKRYKLFNPKEIISNPNNKFNFFNQTFTKEPIYGKKIEPPEIENSYNNNLSYIPSNKFNPRYKIKKFINEEKANPNDVYNYDYKYDDLNSDSDNELSNTDFKAKTMPKFKKIKYDYKNYKTGKIVKEKKDNELLNNDKYMDKNIFHPFLINDDIVNI